MDSVLGPATRPRWSLQALVCALGVALTALLPGCADEPEGIAPAQEAATVVKIDFFHRPLPEIPLPNDLATRYDPESPTGRRINASMVAPTEFERTTRELLDTVDGWGTFQPITIPFSGPLDVDSITAAHRDPDYDKSDDVVFLVDIDPESPEYGMLRTLDLGEGNYPVLLERRDLYGRNDPRGWTLSLLFEEADEDVNGNGVLDPGEDVNGNGVLDPGEDLDGDGELDPPEDTDADGVLDVPNYLPGHEPEREDLAGRADALMTFYERETNTLILRPLRPLRERTTYAVVVTRRLRDAGGRPVGSPYPAVNHNAQTEALAKLPEILESRSDETGGLTLDDIAFAYTFTTQTVQSALMTARDGLYERGPQAHLGEQYPGEIAELYELVDESRYPDKRNRYVMETEYVASLISQLAPALGGDAGESQRQVDALVDSHRYIDYHVIGRFQSPQLFDRHDEDEMPLSLNEQSWPSTLGTEPVEPREEDIFFWLSIPRKEVSARGEGRPAPLVVYAHGYTSNHFDALAFAGFLAQHGVAVLAIDNVSHGISLSPSNVETYGGLASLLGLEGFFRAVVQGRAFDQDNDGEPDSGDDFFSAYAFHTRDMVRQGVLDYMQLVRIVRGFDGQRRWDFDLDGDGTNELAGDFDADGEVDIGPASPICAMGVSLGSFMVDLLGSVEPTIDCVAAILSGGGVTDISVRSLQGGVPEAFALRVMGPLYLGDPHPDGGVVIETLVPSGNDDERRPIGVAGEVRPGDTLIVENLSNGERGCGYVDETGRVRAAVESDRGDRHRLSFYVGPALVTGSTECELRAGAEVREVVETFGHGLPAPEPPETEGDLPQGYIVEFHGELFEHGTELVALADGLALRRANPEFRRLVYLAQAVLDPADPVNWIRHMTTEPLRYADGEETGAHFLSLAMLGDMSVPTSTAAALARAANILPYLETDERYGKSPNQLLIDTYAIEGVHLLGRHQYTPPEGEPNPYPDGVHMDVENFSEGTDIWGDALPRLDPPLRLAGDNGRGGIDAALFGLPRPVGEHGFPLPLELEGRLRAECQDACPEGEDCGCADIRTFDPAFFYFNLMGHYLGTAGTHLSFEHCLSSNDCRCDPAVDGEDCVGWPPPPEERPFRAFDR